MKRLLFTLMVIASSMGWADSAKLAAEIPYLAQPKANLYSAGQPSDKAWELLAQDGVTTVINLRSDAEMAGNNEASLVQENGMNYIHIPIAGAGDISVEKAQLLQQALANTEGKVLVHCASSNRVGALLAIGAATEQTTADALAYGQQAGLTSLQPVVENLLLNKKD